MESKTKRNIFIISVTLILIILIGVTANPLNSTNWIRNVVSVPFSPIQKLFTNISGEIADFITNIKENNSIIEENNELKMRLYQLESEIKKLKELESENERLRKALVLKDKFDMYEIMGANVIAKDSGNWYYSFKTDRGTRDGIEIDAPVIAHDNSLIGRVDICDYTSCGICSLLDEESGISGWIMSESGGTVTIRGDIRLKGEGLCRIDNIPIEVEIKEGDIIETSGLGGIYPKGIIIGTVDSVITGNNIIERYAILKPATDLKKLSEVFIMKKKPTGNE